MAKPGIEKQVSVQEYLDLQAELDQMKGKLVEQALAEIEKQKQILVQLGYVETPAPVAKPKQVKEKGTPSVSDKPCPKCGQLGHDGRFHRGDKKKAPQAEAAGQS